MRMIYRSKRSVCLCMRARICMWFIRIVCDVAYYNVRERTVHLIQEQVPCFGMFKLQVLIPFFSLLIILFRHLIFSFVHHFTTLFQAPPPHPTDMGNVYLQ